MKINFFILCCSWTFFFGKAGVGPELKATSLCNLPKFLELPVVPTALDFLGKILLQT